MKLKSLILLALAMLLLTVPVYATTGTITGTIARFSASQWSPPAVELVLTCTADITAHTYPVTIINDLSGISSYDLRGMRLHSIKTIPGTTGPTDDTDVTITDKYGIDLLGGKGTNAIDNATTNWIVFGYSTYVIEPLITGNITITITNNAVNSAVVTVVIELVGP